jgi:hypothetical protein
MMNASVVNKVSLSGTMDHTNTFPFIITILNFQTMEINTKSQSSSIRLLA